MDKKVIQSIQARIESEREYRNDLDAYDRIVNLKWELPNNWQAKEWVRKKISTDGHDAVRTATNIYDTNKPIWEILPRGMADKDSAEQLETALEWWMQRANKVGEHEPLRKSLHNSCLQNRVIYQLDYLPYWLPKDKSQWSKEQKAAMKASSYCIICHDARNVLHEMGMYGLKWAASVTVMPAQDVIDRWSVYAHGDDAKDLGNGFAEVDTGVSEEGKQISSALRKIKAALKENEDLKYIHVDYTSHEKREVSVFPTTHESWSDFENYEEGNEKIDILDTENKLTFINWVIVTGESTPLLYAMHKAGLWEDQNLYDTIIDSTTMRRAVFPILKHTSPTGKPLDIDYEGEQDVIELQGNEQVDIMQPPAVDPAMATIDAQNTAKIAQATGIKGLASVEIAGNVQYAAIQAVIQLHMTSLVPYVRTVEKANAQLGDMMFMWLQQGDGYTETAKRVEDEADGRMKGMGIIVTPDDFDPDDLYITCELTANTPTDKMQTANYYATLINAGAKLDWKYVVEKLKEGNGDVREAEWLDGQALTIALQNKVKQLDAEIQLMVAQKQAEIQMATQPPPAPAQPTGKEQPDQSNPMIPGGQMMNAAMGGETTATSMPGSTSPIP